MDTYNIIVLGASGSGKTSLLASMYHKLSIQDENIGFFIEVSPNQRKRLIETYIQIAHPEMDWPPGTLRSEVPEWKFTCAIKSKQGDIYRVFDFIYLDYAGEIITDSNYDSENNVSGFNIDPAAKNADAILVLIDGQKVLYLMQNKASSFAKLERDLGNILPIVQNITHQPVHFIVTKWDLLENKYTLKEVRSKLIYEMSNFKKIIGQLNKDKTQLIPVSAFGSGFAELDKDGSMSKNINQKPTPFQVEVPLSCSLSNIFKDKYSNLYLQSWSAIFMLKRLGLLSVLMTLKVSKHFSGLPLPVIGPLIGEVIEEGARSGIEDKMKHEQEASRKKIVERQEMLLEVMQNIKIIVNDLSKDFPYSNFGNL